MTTRTPPLREVHESRGARFTDFGGWEMPVEFDSIRAEHAAVRDAVGKFDVSHMGEIEVSGPDATELMGRLTTNDPASLDPGESQYATITDERGVVLDDTVIYRREEGFLFVPNAGHDAEMADRWEHHRDRWGLEAEVENVTDERAMFAVQGPDAEERLVEAASEEVADLDRFEATTGEVAGVECLIARTGYTGEDGFELILPTGGAERVWETFECQPCGLGARDTLRMEMGFLLSGQDFHPEENPRNPYEMGVAFVVDLDTEFVGRDALAAIEEGGPRERFVGIELEERGVPRHGYAIEAPDGDRIGEVTSGTMSPTLDVPIGLGYVPAAYAEPGTDVRVVIRSESKTARVRETPFLDE